MVKINVRECRVRSRECIIPSVRCECEWSAWKQSRKGNGGTSEGKNFFRYIFTHDLSFDFRTLEDNTKERIRKVVIQNESLLIIFLDLIFFTKCNWIVICRNVDTFFKKDCFVFSDMGCSFYSATYQPPWWVIYIITVQKFRSSLELTEIVKSQVTDFLL